MVCQKESFPGNGCFEKMIRTLKKPKHGSEFCFFLEFTTKILKHLLDCLFTF